MQNVICVMWDNLETYTHTQTARFSFVCNSKGLKSMHTEYSGARQVYKPLSQFLQLQKRKQYSPCRLVEKIGDSINYCLMQKCRVIVHVCQCMSVIRRFLCFLNSFKTEEETTSPTPTPFTYMFRKLKTDSPWVRCTLKNSMAEWWLLKQCEILFFKKRIFSMLLLFEIYFVT